MDTRIDLHLLRLFVAVAEELHFGRAAKRLGTSQPPLSQQIRRLEGLLGCALFERTSRRVALTDAGRELLAHAYRILAEMERAVEHARAVAAGGTGVIEIGYVVPAMLRFLPLAIRRFRAEQPGVVLRLREMSTAPQLEALGTGELDVALVSGECPEKQVRTWMTWTEPAVVLLPPAHALADRREVQVGELAEEDFISFPRAQAPDLYERWAGACRAGGFTPRVVQEAQSWQMIAALVSAGLGIAIAPASAAAVAALQVSSPTLRCDAPIFRMSLCTRTDLSPTLRAFVQAARAEAESQELEIREPV